MKDNLDKARSWIADADRILVSAGAGLSAAAGFDYGDQKRFAELFPFFHSLGMRARYQAIGLFDWPETLHWAFWAIHVNDIRFGPAGQQVYHDLFSLVRGKDCFVATTNVDQLFPRNGFDPSFYSSMQGDYGLLQCRRACTQATWDSRPVVERLLNAMHPDRQEIADTSAIPQCPNCGGEVFFNVRLDRNFIDVPRRDQETRYQDWLMAAQRQSLLILEIGVGFNTPGILRFPLESLTARNPGCRMIRINPENAEFPANLGARGIGLKLGAADALSALRN